MTAASDFEDLHALVERPKPDQVDAVRAVVLELVAGGHPNGETSANEALPRRLSFTGLLSAEPDFAERSEGILNEIVARNAG